MSKSGVPSLSMRKTGWLAFGLWAVPGIVVGFQVSVIGVLLLPLGLVATVLLVKFTRVWPELFGIFEGMAAVCLIVALNADYWSCPSSGEIITRTEGSVTVESCGSPDPWPWLIAGLVFAIGGAVAYGVARRPRGMARDGHVRAGA